MKSIAEEFDEYCAMVYPEGISGIQRKETRQAFLSGFLSALITLSKLSTEVNADEAVAAVEKVFRETTRELEKYCPPNP